MTEYTKRIAEGIQELIIETTKEIDPELLATIHIGIEAEANTIGGMHIHVSITEHEPVNEEIINSHHSKIEEEF